MRALLYVDLAVDARVTAAPPMWTEPVAESTLKAGATKVKKVSALYTHRFIDEALKG